MSRTLHDFLLESNRIEGIDSVRPEEVRAAKAFLDLPLIGVEDLIELVRVIEPGAELRDRRGMNVRIGRHYPPGGGPKIREQLHEILLGTHRHGRHQTHIAYETLHPFTDGNGRSGRMLWLWQSWEIVPRVPSLGFLHSWYYESLDAARRSGTI